MSLQLFISYAILFAIPLILAPIAIWVIRWFEQRLPPAQRAALDYFAEKAAKNIEQTSKGTSLQKKNAAVTMIYAFFDGLKPPIPIPGHALIEAAIETVVWEINKSKIPDEFLTDDKPNINTGPIKPVQPLGGQTV